MKGEVIIMRKMLIGLLLVVGIACCVIPVSTSDMMFRFNAAHSGDYTPVAETTGTTLVKIWTHTTGGLVYSSPAIATASCMWEVLITRSTLSKTPPLCRNGITQPGSGIPARQYPMAWYMPGVG